MEGISTPKLEAKLLIEDYYFLITAHFDEVEDHSNGMIYYDKPDLRSHSFGVKDYVG